MYFICMRRRECLDRPVGDGGDSGISERSQRVKKKHPDYGEGFENKIVM